MVARKKPATRNIPSSTQALPLPSVGWRTEAQPDGSLRVVDVMPLANVVEFVRGVAVLMRSGSLDLPAWIEVVTPEGAMRLADGGSDRALWGDTLDKLAGILSSRDGCSRFELRLACGCGTRVEVQRAE